MPAASNRSVMPSTGASRYPKRMLERLLFVRKWIRRQLVIYSVFYFVLHLGLTLSNSRRLSPEWLLDPPKR